MFLSQLGLNGVLSVVRDSQMLTLSFAAGYLLSTVRTDFENMELMG